MLRPCAVPRFRRFCRRSLRVVNPSPYMVYLQARGCILVASSPEILCRVGEDGTVTNRCVRYRVRCQGWCGGWGAPAVWLAVHCRFLRRSGD